MSMTYEEAARILDPETSQEALCEIEFYGGFRGEEARLEACNEACRVAAKVLREPQAVRLDDTGAQALALAAEVSELRQELEAAKTLQDAAWISVKERLPEDDVMVLCTVSGKPRDWITLDGAIEIASHSRAEGWIVETWPEWEDPKVTHWAPLPEPPKED